MMGLAAGISPVSAAIVAELSIRLGRAEPGKARQSRHGAAGRGRARHGKAGSAGRGGARLGSAGQSRQLKARQIS